MATDTDERTNEDDPMAGQTRSTSRLPLIIGGAVVLIAVLVGGFLYLTRDTSDEKLTLTEDTSAGGGSVDVASLDGTWTVAPGTGDDTTVAGYRVEEEFVAGARKVTANGRTNDVTGTMTVAGGSVTEGSFTVDMTTLTSDEGRRDQVIKSRGLEADQFPKATFALTEPITLPTEVADGETFAATATGDLTLHGVTKAVTIELTGRASGDTFAVQGSAPVAMADYDIEPPSVGGFVKVSDSGSFEFLVTFTRA